MEERTEAGGMITGHCSGLFWGVSRNVSKRNDKENYMNQWKWVESQRKGEGFLRERRFGA